MIGDHKGHERVINRGYTITRNHLGEYAITCHKCDRISYNKNDVENRYCGFCHVFHEDKEKGQQ